MYAFDNVNHETQGIKKKKQGISPRSNFGGVFHMVANITHFPSLKDRTNIHVLCCEEEKAFGSLFSNLS